jgi:transcriptional regulator with XRE-family HTH domain
MSIKEMFSNVKFECGTKSAYNVGCRCDKCKKSRSEYEAKRQQIRREEGSNVWIATDQVKAHLEFLRKNGIGLRTVCQYANIARSTLVRILNGKNSKIRKHRAQTILDVDLKCINGGTLVSSVPSRRIIKSLLAEDFTKKEIAKRLGYRTRAIQFAKTKKMTARTARRLERFYNVLNLEGEI